MAFRRAYRRTGADKGINTLFVPVGNPGIVKDVSEEVFMIQPAFQSSYLHADPQTFSVISLSAAIAAQSVIFPGAGSGALEPAPSGFVWLIPEMVVQHSNPTSITSLPVLIDTRMGAFGFGGQPLGRVDHLAANWAYFRNLVIPSGHSMTMFSSGWTAGAVNIQARAFLVEAGLDPWFGGVQCGVS